MLYIGQRNEKWSENFIGKSKTTIGQAGCAICSSLMVLSKFWPERGFSNFVTPAEAARDWVFTGIKEDPEPKYINWVLSKQAFKNIGFEFKWRNWWHLPNNYMRDPVTDDYDFEKNIIKKYLKSRNFGITFELETQADGKHWVAGVSPAIFKGRFGYSCNDPYTNNRKWFIPYPYKKITGWTLFEKYEN